MDRIPTRNELLYLLETNQISKLVETVKNLPPEVRNSFDTDLKNQIGRALKDFYNTTEPEQAHYIHENQQVSQPQIVESTPQVAPTTNKYITVPVETEVLDFDEPEQVEALGNTPNTPESNNGETPVANQSAAYESYTFDSMVEQPLYDEEKYLSELTNLCRSLGITINSSSTSKNGAILPFISFDLSRGFDPYYDNILLSLCEEKFIDLRFSRKYQNEFDFIVKLNNKSANMGYIFAKLVEAINSTNVETDYSKMLPGDLDNLKKIYFDENENSNFHQVIYTKLEDNKYAYLLNSDLDIYMDFATNAGFTECASGTNLYRTAQLISYDKEDSADKLDHLSSSIRYANSMYTNMMANHANEVLKEFVDVPFEQITNIYNTYRVMDGGNSIVSVVVGTPLENKNQRVVKIFRPTVSPTETRMLFKYNDGVNFDNEILPKLVSTFANNGRTKTTIGVVADSPRAFYQAMSDYGDTLSLANMSVRSINNTKQLLNETNRVYHHVQRDLISEYERMNVINGFMASILFPFLMAFTSLIAIAMIIQIIMNS